MEFEVGIHNGAYKGSLHSHVPFIGRKTLNVQQKTYNDIHGYYRAWNIPEPASSDEKGVTSGTAGRECGEKPRAFEAGRKSHCERRHGNMRGQETP